jgi:phosphoribosylamine--glycine ligase
MHPRFRPGAAVTTVVASEGYPGPIERGRPIDLSAVPEGDDAIVFHAGTRLEGGQLVTAGGRVLACTGLGDTMEEAARRSREAAASVGFEGATFRRDIGWRELQRSN